MSLENRRLAMVGENKRSIKSEITRTAIIMTAASIFRKSGPTAVTHRKVAELAQISPSSVTYHFASISDLLYQAGLYIFSQWIACAENAMLSAKEMSDEEAREHQIELLMEACLPARGRNYTGHYCQLLWSEGSEEVKRAYKQRRERIEECVQFILDKVGWKISPGLVIATVDGASIVAISEGRPFFKSIEKTIRELAQFSQS